MPARQAHAPLDVPWCGHTGRYQVTAIMCGARGWSDRMMRCEECGREYLASVLAEIRTGHHHKQPRGAKPPPGATRDRPAHERAGASERTRGMNAPITQTGNPEARQQGQRADHPTEDLGEGHVMGNLTDDPELRFTGTGRAVARLRVAYTPRVKDDASGRWKDGDTEFYDINAWGPQGERCAEHLQRGDRVVATGTWTKRKWEDREGKERESVELTARDIGPSLLFRGAAIVRERPGQGGASHE